MNRFFGLDLCEAYGFNLFNVIRGANKSNSGQVRQSVS